MENNPFSGREGGKKIDYPGMSSPTGNLQELLESIFENPLVDFSRRPELRKVIVFSMITLDGVMQAPGGPREDSSGGFRYGGWVAPFGDAAYDKVVRKELEPAEYLLGRKTFKIWEGYWPDHGDFWPGINDGTKYVLSKTVKKTGWKNTVFLKSVNEIKKVKKSKGPDLHVWGSSELVQLLLKHDLVDELRLKIHPLILGKGKKLFAGNALPTTFKLYESKVTSTGVFIAYFARTGKVKTGTVGKRYK
jgi:dihydrofolate reductase